MPLQLAWGQSGKEGGVKVMPARTIYRSDRPFGVALEPGGKLVWTADHRANALTVRNADNARVVQQIPCGEKPTCVVLDASRQRAYGVSSGDGTLRVFDMLSYKPLETIRTGRGATFAALDTIKNRMWVANADENAVTVVDLDSGSTRTLAAGEGPSGVCVDAARRRVFVANSGGATISLFHADTMVRRDFKVPQGPFQLTLAGPQGVLFASHPLSDIVSRTEFTEAGQIARIETVGVGEYPHNLAADNKRGLVSVSNLNGGSISILSLEGDVVDEQSVGHLPVGLDVDTVTGRFWTAGSVDNSLAIVSPVVLPHRVLRLRQVTYARRNMAAESPITVQQIASGNSDPTSPGPVPITTATVAEAPASSTVVARTGSPGVEEARPAPATPASKPWIAMVPPELPLSPPPLTAPPISQAPGAGAPQSGVTLPPAAPTVPRVPVPVPPVVPVTPISPITALEPAPVAPPLPPVPQGQGGAGGPSVPAVPPANAPGAGSGIAPPVAGIPAPEPPEDDAVLPAGGVTVPGPFGGIGTMEPGLEGAAPEVTFAPGHIEYASAEDTAALLSLLGGIVSAPPPALTARVTGTLAADIVSPSAASASSARLGASAAVAAGNSPGINQLLLPAPPQTVLKVQKTPQQMMAEYLEKNRAGGASAARQYPPPVIPKFGGIGNGPQSGQMPKFPPMPGRTGNNRSSQYFGGVKPWVAASGHFCREKFQVATIHGVAQRSNASGHPVGLALDFMVYDNAAKGDAIAAHYMANAHNENVAEVIWKQRIWTPGQRDWRPLPSRGGRTADHYDHVHVTFTATPNSQTRWAER